MIDKKNAWDNVASRNGLFVHSELLSDSEIADCAKVSSCWISGVNRDGWGRIERKLAIEKLAIAAYKNKVSKDVSAPAFEDLTEEDQQGWRKAVETVLSFGSAFEPTFKSIILQSGTIGVDGRYR